MNRQKRDAAAHVVEYMRMLTISKSLSAGQARTYHSREFTSEKQNYWSRDQQAHSEWQGRLAQEWGLHGEVGSEHFARLSEGQHPEKRRAARQAPACTTYENEYGKEITSVEHRAGMGCHILRAEVRLAHRPCGRR
jgi:hypothetical protein